MYRERVDQTGYTMALSNVAPDISRSMLLSLSSFSSSRVVVTADLRLAGDLASDDTFFFTTPPLIFLAEGDLTVPEGTRFAAREGVLLDAIRCLLGSAGDSFEVTRAVGDEGVALILSETVLGALPPDETVRAADPSTGSLLTSL